MDKTFRAHLALFVTQVLYASSFPIAKIVMEVVPSNVLVALRVIGAVVLLFITAIFIREKVEKKDLFSLFILGLSGVAINQSFFLNGLHLTSPINAAIIMIISPIIVLIIASILIKEKITATKAIGVAVGFTGAAFLIYQNISFSDKQSSFIGDLYIFINAVAFGVFLVLARPLMQKYNTVTVLKWTFLFGLPLILPFAIHDGIDFDWSVLSPRIILYISFIVVCVTYLAYLLNTFALKQLSPSIVSAYIYLQPVLTALITIFIFKNGTLTWEKSTAALLICIGVYLTGMRKRSTKGKVEFSDEIEEADEDAHPVIEEKKSSTC